MLRSFQCILGLAFALSTLASAQTPQPTSTVAPAAATATSSQPTPTTIRTGAKLVVVDITVSDKNGTPLHELKKEDFTVLENGNPQSVNTFEEHIALSASDAVKFPPLPPMPPGVFTNITPAPINSAVNIILIDTLITPSDDQAYRALPVGELHQPRAPRRQHRHLHTRLPANHSFKASPPIWKS